MLDNGELTPRLVANDNNKVPCFNCGGTGWEDAEPGHSDDFEDNGCLCCGGSGTCERGDQWAWCEHHNAWEKKS